ncbi:MATE family efflux transporter [Phenylobacterium sp. J367]|uniref:MATE family efflux transporter n=1 Tax=Phenylobacterium sp. J367 TaxID=2898435 RepID=UPI002150C97F|nr:MATE family efflux transporter [Phenylobacterium sp. J367]MCR5877990.1 MATE family efflux transporter [Phenylobacterium sp. J367]
MTGQGAATGGRPGVSRKGPDLTAGPIGKTLILFALPVLGTNILQSLNGSANAIWVSHVLGETALTATANANQIMFLMLGAVFGVSMASNILIGQAVGAGDEALARKVVGTSTAFFIVLSLSVGALGVTLTPHILDAMGTPADARGDAIAYLRVIFTAMPFMYFFSFVMMAQRGTGDSRTPFYFSLLTVGLDVILNPLLIIGPGPLPTLGIAGSATATLVAQTTTLLAMLIHLYRKGSILVIRPSEARLLIPDLAILRALVLKGLPMGFQMMVISLAAVTMMGLVNQYGSHTAAAYGAAAQLWTYVQMPAMALGAAVSSMAAQNVGAGRMDRVEQVARRGALFALLFTTAPVVALFFADPFVLRLFLPGDSPSLPIALHINSIVLWGFIPFGIAFIFSGVVRATGAVWPPLLAMIISLWVVRIPLANLLEPHIGADAVWLSFPIGSFTTLALAGGYYLWGGWRKAKMLDAPPTSDAPDTGFGQPVIEEAEAVAGASRSSPSAPHR